MNKSLIVAAVFAAVSMGAHAHGFGSGGPSVSGSAESSVAGSTNSYSVATGVNQFSAHKTKPPLTLAATRALSFRGAPPTRPRRAAR